MMFIKRFEKNRKQFIDMGLREKVALVLTTLAFTQITTTQCVPSGSRMAPLQRHLEARGIKSTQSPFDNVAKITKNSPPKRSMYKAYNFPETEYPVDSSPRDPFYYGIDPVGLAEHEAPNQKFKAFNDMKKDMRMKRKLNMINENRQASSDSKPIWLQDKDLFPEVQYPLKSMDTWVPYYGNPYVLTQNDQRQKFSELLCEKSKRTSDPHKEDLKLKTKLLLDEINKIKEKMNSSKAHSKSGTNSTRLYTTKDFPTPGVRSTENLIKSDTNATQISFATNEASPYQTSDAVNEERLAIISISKNSETKNFSKQLDAVNISTVSELPVTLKTDFDNGTIMSIPIPYKVCELMNETGTSDSKNKDVIKFKEEPESSIILENKHNASVQIIDHSISTDNTRDNFQQVITNALIDLILTHISSKKNYKNHVLASNDNDTRICIDSSAKSPPVEEDEDADLLPNDAHKQQGLDSMLNDDPLNVKLPLPASSKDESIPTHVSIKNDTQISDINKAPCSRIIVIPVGDTINKIQSPIVETTTATPIIVFISSTPQSNISVSTLTNIPFALPSISEGESNVPFGNLPNITFINETSQNADVISDLSNVQLISIGNISINTQEIRNASSVKPDFETLCIKPMCHDSAQDKITSVTQQNDDTFIKKNVPMMDIVCRQDNPSSLSLDYQSANLFEAYPNNCVEEVSSDEKIVAIDKLPTTEEAVTQPLLLNNKTNKDTFLVSNKDNSSNTLKDSIDSSTISAPALLKNDLIKVDDIVSSAVTLTDVNKETNVTSSEALASSLSVSKDHLLPNQREMISTIREFFSDETITDINNLPTTTGEVPVSPLPLHNTEDATRNVLLNEVNSTKPEDGKGIRHISASNTPKEDLQKIEKNNTITEVNKDATLLPLNKLLETQDANVIKKNPIVLDKILKEVNNEVLTDTPLEDKNIKGRSLLDWTNDSLMNKTLQSHELKDINTDTSMPLKVNLDTSLLQDTLIPEDKHLLNVQNDANESPSSKNNTLVSDILTNTTRIDPQLIKNDSIPNNELIEIITDIEKASNTEECADTTINESENSFTSSVNKSLEQNQLLNTTDSLVHEDLTEFLLQDTSTLDNHQDLPYLVNPSYDRDENDVDFIEHNDFFSIPFDITKDRLSLPKGMLICSGISEVPRNLKSESLPYNGIASSETIKQTDMASDEAILPIHKVLQETPVTEIAKNETITKVEVRQNNELADIEKAIPNNYKKNLDTDTINQTENIAPNITFNTDVKVSVNNTLPDPPDSYILDNNSLDLNTGVNKNNTVTKDIIPLKKDKKSLENLSSDSNVIHDATTQAIKNKTPKSAKNDQTSAELSDLIKYLYDSV